MIPSPCIGLCRLDPESALCQGCARSGTEIASWKDAADRDRVWADLPRRRADLGITLHREGWTPDEILRFVAASLRGDAGTWTLGTSEVVARFGPGERPSLAVDPSEATITTTAPTGAIRFRITDRARVLSRSDLTNNRPGQTILAIPRSGSAPRPHQGLTPLGKDNDAIRSQDRDGWLFDLGVGSPSASLCVRTTDPALAADLTGRAGQDASSVRSRLEDEADCVWVVLNSLVRLEFFEASGGCQPPVFDPTVYQEDWGLTPPARPENPFGDDIPESFVPCAIFQPGAVWSSATPTARSV